MFSKKHVFAILALALVCALAGAGILSGAQPAASAETVTTVVTSPFTEAIAEVRGSVVGINNYQTVRYSNYGNNWTDYFGWGFGNGYGGRDQDTTQEVKAAYGSGVVIAEGYVLTNYHVVEDASSLKIAVMPENSDTAVEYDAILVASDSNLDVAILYAPSLPNKPVRLGDSDTLQVGDWAICIGNPLSEKFYGTVTAGIVSALDRTVSSSSYDRYGRRETITNTMIQTDAAINNGNSGGGMFSVTGELMGIPTIKYSGSVYSGASIDGIGMCIPINAAKPLINDVLSGVIETPAAEPETREASSGEGSGSLVGRPRLGVTISSMNPSSAAILSGKLPNGVYVKEVEAGSPAENGGMQVGDIIVDVDGTVISSVSQLQQVISAHGEGDVLVIKVYRVPGLNDAASNAEIGEGEYIDLQVTLAIVDDVRY